MKGKRHKAYRKLIHQYEIGFGFRPPFQILLDSAIVQDSARYKIDLIGRLNTIFGGQVKPLISTCCMRHLYNAQPKDEALILQAKTYERKRCGHHELETPLSSLECLTECVDPKGSSTNKNRYIVASDDPKVRAHMRGIPGVPIIYISKSVVILEPMAASSEDRRERDEKAKFKAGLKGRRGADSGQKRKREEEAEDDKGQHHDESIGRSTTGDAGPQMKKRTKGPKGPNPLSVKKSKKRPSSESGKPAFVQDQPAETNIRRSPSAALVASAPEVTEADKPKRKRKHKPKRDDMEERSRGGDTAIS